MLSHGATLAAGPAGAGAPTDPAPAPAPVPRHAARSSADDFVTTEERRRLAARLIRHLERNSAMTPAAVRAHVRTVEQDVYQGAGGLRKAYVAAFIRKMQDKILSPQQQRDAQRLYWEEVARLREAYGEALAARRRALKRAIRVCGTKTGYFGIELTIEKLYDDLNKVAVLIGFVSAKSAQLSAAPSMDAFPRVEAMIQALLARKIGWGVDSEDGAIPGVAGTAASRASRCTVAPPSPATLAMPPPTVPTAAFLTTNLAGDEADDLMVPDLGASADAGDTGCSDNTVPVAVANVQVARASGCRGRVSAAVYASVVSTGADHRNGTGVGGDNGDSNDHCFSVVPEWSCCAEEEGGGGGGERGGGEAGGGWSGQSGVSAVVARSGDKRTSSTRRVDARAAEADEEEGADGDEFVEGCAFRAAKRQRVVY